MDEPEIKRIDSKVVYKNRWMSVREDRVRRPNGDHGLFGVVDKPDVSLIVPFDGEKFTLVQQYRYPVDGRYWEFPQGVLEFNAEATPEEIAKAELLAETGLVAGSIVNLGKLFQAYGYSNQGIHLFFATDLEASSSAASTAAQGLISETFTRIELDKLLADSQITDVATVAALQRVERHMKAL